jgi:hypothetical protein
MTIRELTFLIIVLMIGIAGISHGEKMDWEKMAVADFTLNGYPMDMGYRLSKSDDPELRKALYSGLTGSPDKWVRNNCAIAASYLKDDVHQIEIVSIAFQKEKDETVKKSLFRILSASSSDNNIPVLVSIIDQYKSLTAEPESSYRKDAIKSLGNFGDKGWPFLENVIHSNIIIDSDKVIAIQALASSDTTPVIPILLQYHNDNSSLIRNQVVQSLAKLSRLSLDSTLKDNVFTALSQRINDKDYLVRIETLKAFVQLQDDRALPVIEKIAQIDPYETKKAIFQFGKEVMETHYPVREVAANMIGEYKHVKTLRENPDLRLLILNQY